MDVPFVIPVHQQHVAHQRGEQNAPCHADAAPPFAHGDHQQRIDHRHDQVGYGTELVHILGALDLQAHRLDGRNQRGGKQQQCHDIVRGRVVALCPGRHKRPAYCHKAKQNHHHHDKLDPPHFREQPAQFRVFCMRRHHPVYAGRQHIGHRRGKGQIVGIELIAQIVHSRRFRAVLPVHHQLSDTPVDVIHHNADKHPYGKAHHLAHQAEIVMAEADGHPQLCKAVVYIQHAA